MPALPRGLAPFCPLKDEKLSVVQRRLPSRSDWATSNASFERHLRRTRCATTDDCRRPVPSRGQTGRRSFQGPGWSRCSGDSLRRGLPRRPESALLWRAIRVSSVTRLQPAFHPRSRACTIAHRKASGRRSGLNQHLAKHGPSQRRLLPGRRPRRKALTSNIASASSGNPWRCLGFTSRVKSWPRALSCSSASKNTRYDSNLKRRSPGPHLGRRRRSATAYSRIVLLP
jgi:hypothetical protein